MHKGELLFLKGRDHIFIEAPCKIEAFLRLNVDVGICFNGWRTLVVNRALR